MRDVLRDVLRFSCLAAPAVLAACDLEEIMIVEVEDIVIAEIYVNLAEDPTENEVRAYLHYTVGAPASGGTELSSASIVVSRPDGLTLTPYVNLLNVYNQRNVLFYFFEYQQSPPVRSGVSMFPVLPTFGLEVRF